MLKAKIAEISLKKHRGPGKGGKIEVGVSAESGSSGCAEVDAADLTAAIRKWANYFGLFHGLFINVEDFRIENRPDFRSDDLVRWASAKNQASGTTASLYEVLPDKYHDIMALSSSQSNGHSFISEVCFCIITMKLYSAVNICICLLKFRGALSSSRSSTLQTLRKLAPDALNIPRKYFQPSGSTQRDEDPEIRVLIGMKINLITNEVSYDLIPPVLCLNGDNSDVKNYFQHPCLYMVSFIPSITVILHFDQL